MNFVGDDGESEHRIFDFFVYVRTADSTTSDSLVRKNTCAVAVKKTIHIVFYTSAAHYTTEALISQVVRLGVRVCIC